MGNNYNEIINDYIEIQYGLPFIFYKEMKDLFLLSNAYIC